MKPGDVVRLIIKNKTQVVQILSFESGHARILFISSPGKPTGFVNTKFLKTDEALGLIYAN